MADKKIRNDASSSGGGNSRGESVVIDVGRHRSSCGYCRSDGRTNTSHGLWADSLTVDHYQGLLDRGWRRSGCFLYKPEMERACCPSYTIRLRTSDFIPSKEQIRVSRRLQRFLDGTLNTKKSDEFIAEPNIAKHSSGCDPNEIAHSKARKSLTGKCEATNKAEEIVHYLSEQIGIAVRAVVGSGEFPCDIQLPEVSIKKVTSSKRKLLVEGSEDLVFSTNISFQIAATLKRAKNGVPGSESSGESGKKSSQFFELSPQLIAEQIASSLNQSAGNFGLSVRSCNGHINFYAVERQAWLDEVVESVGKESAAGSRTRRNRTKEISECPQRKGRRLEILLKRSSFDPEEYALYRRYQITVHNETPDQVTESSYRQFLVDSPLVFVPSTGIGMSPPCGFGSFHQQYVIDGQLVAVGVIDILPKCLSSKYLFWDPDLAFLSLGKYSALQEIEWVKKNQVHCPSLEYYYLGYYIHSCSKMRYKAAYRPSELLCPLRYQWVSFNIARPLLDQKPYVILSNFANLASEESPAPNVLENSTELQHDEPGLEDKNDNPFDQDEEMDGFDSEDSDDELGSERSDWMTLDVKDESLSNILVTLKGSRLRYKDLQHPLCPSKRRYLETRLHQYMRAVGTELSEQMVYSLG